MLDKSIEAARVLSDARVESFDRNESFNVVTNQKVSKVEMGDAAFYGTIGEFVKLMMPHTEADPVALLVQCLVCFGNIVNRTAHCLIEGTKHHLNLYLVLVGRSAFGRKGTSWGRVGNLFRKVDPEWYQKSIVTSLSSGEGMISKLQDGTESSVQLASKKRLMVNTGEFAGVLKVLSRDGNLLSPVLRDAWDGIKLEINTRNSPIAANDSHVSFIGHVTQTELMKNLTQTETLNGFANRFLWLAVGRSKLLPEPSDPDPKDEARIVSYLKQAVAFASEQGNIGFSNEARELWNFAYRTVLNEERPGMSGLMQVRGPPIVRRLGVIYALLDLKSEVGAVHLEAALALWEYSLNSCKAIFGDSLGNRNSDKILNAIRESPAGLSKTEIIREVFSNNIKSGVLDDAISVLCNEGLAEISESVDPTTQRKRTVLRLSDASKHTNLTNLRI